MLMESSMTAAKKATRNNKQVCAPTPAPTPIATIKTTRATKAVETPAVVTPVKANKPMDTPDAPIQTRYSTRSNTKTVTTSKKNLKQDFDAEFFDESSAAWNQNKKKLGNGMYAYRTRSTTRK
jgi:hypothetical protein